MAWQGIIFGTGPNDRVYPQCLTSRRDKNSADVSVSNHQQIAVQLKNVMIAQANLARKDIEAMRVYVADDPMTCVARGAGAVLEDLDRLHTVLASLQRGSTVH